MKNTPKERIDEINSKLAEEERAVNEAANREAEANYLTKIEEGDDFFNNSDYEGAIASYKQALSFQPDQAYPVDRINEIELLIADQEELAANNNNLYHIVVGSFEDDNNAQNLLQKLEDLGVNARLVSRLDGEYTAVIFSSYPSINDAYNNLSEVREQMGHAWIIYKRF